MKFEHRQYQEDAAQALYEAIQVPDIKPVIAVPTAGGKTVIMGLFFKKYLQDNPDNKIVVLSHTQNIIEQDFESLSHIFPELHIGIYSAGLGEKELGQITIAGIQSAINNSSLFRWTNLYMVDEVHSVNHAAKGSYRKLLDGSLATITGMSATVYRSGHGYIYEGKGTLFNKLAYDLTSAENFTKLIDDGYLSDIISVAPDLQLDSSKVRKSGGDYNIKHLAATHDKYEITKAAIDEALPYTRNYKKWLVFAIDIDHADHISDYLTTVGIKSNVLHSRIKDDRKEVEDQFRNGDITALVSVGMITTGFDVPDIDLILMLRPTQSAVLWVQMAGRGLRIAPGKKHCLLLDFAGNTSALGPINNVQIPIKGNSGKGKAPVKKCPKCRTLVHISIMTCPSCNYEFPRQEKILTKSDRSDIIDRSNKIEPVQRWIKVTSVRYKVHKRPGRKDSVIATYLCGIKRVNEWLGIEENNYPGDKARHKLSYRGYRGPIKASAVVAKQDELKVPSQLYVDFAGKWPNIIHTKFD